MTAHTTRQYRPISSSETATDDGLTPRFCRDMADNVNNYARALGAHKVIAQLCVPEWKSHSATTEERVVWVSGPRLIPDGFTDLTVVAHHYRTEGADDVVWKLYCVGWPYAGPVALNTAYLLPGYSTCTWTSSGGDLSRYATDSFDVVRGPIERRSFFVLTATNGDGSTRAALTSLDAWPDNVFAQVDFQL